MASEWTAPASDDDESERDGVSDMDARDAQDTLDDLSSVDDQDAVHDAWLNAGPTLPNPIPLPDPLHDPLPPLDPALQPGTLNQPVPPHPAMPAPPPAPASTTTPAGAPTPPVIAVRQLTKTYLLGRTRVPALRGVSLVIHRREFVAIMGPSGSGKSTFMNLVGCLDTPTGGEYWLGGVAVGKMSPDQLADVRARRIGFVFQGFNLLPRATALQNVELPMLYAGITPAERTRRAERALRLVGLGGRMHHKPAELSGGQQQRVAIARALVNGPALLLADEPTGNLDSHTSLEILAVLQALNERGLTIVLVTHEPDIAAYAQRQISFRDGWVVGDTPMAAPRSARAEWARANGSVSAAPGAPSPSIRVREERA
jgi:putative ABC transport system ATP-binding protein